MEGNEENLWWSGFHKKSLRERQLQLQLAFPHVFDVDDLDDNSGDDNAVSPLGTPLTTARNSAVNLGAGKERSIGASDPVDIIYAKSKKFGLRPLEEATANNMIENCVGILGLPIGVAPSFVIDGSPVVVPMATEEPSVIAACNSAAKTVAVFGSGFKTACSTRNTIQAQIRLSSLEDFASVSAAFNKIRDDFISEANSFCKSMVQRGGGVVDAYLRRVHRKTGTGSDWVVLNVVVDVCDSMGANCANTVAEGVRPFLTSRLPVSVHAAIVSNLNPLRTATAEFKVAIEDLSYKGYSGKDIAEGVVEMYQWANDDPMRSATHNKGIMNGIDALALATGQDFRAIEASCHTYAHTKKENEMSLSEFWIDEGALHGKLQLPLSVGVVGGSIRSNPIFQYTLGMLGNPDSKTLSQVSSTSF